MNIINDYIQDNKYVFKYYEYTVSIDSITIKIPKTNSKLFLCENDIKRLINKELITNSSFAYHEHYGFTYEEYGEYFVGTEFPMLLSLYDLYGDLGDMHVEFKIGCVLYEFSPVSDIACLLIEPYISKYEYSVADKGLREYFYTLKLFGINKIEYKDEVIMGLYYLNSIFNKKRDITLSIYNIFPNDFDFKFAESFVNGEFDDDYRESKTLTIIKVKIVNDYKSTEPLQLYIYAKTLSGTDQFIAFYRILEYFFLRSQSYKIEKLRYKKNISSIELLKEISLKDERTKLCNLEQQICTPIIKKNILNKYNLNKVGSDQITNLKTLSDHIYSFRCSLVHAKEEDISKT